MKKRLFLSTAIAAALAVWTAGCCIPKVAESLPVTLHPQETHVWCWAASAQMVMDYQGHNVFQCEQANRQFDRNDCCGPSRPQECVNVGWPQFGEFGFTFLRTSFQPLSWEALKREISRGTSCGNSPFCFTWVYAGGSAHMMVCVGYYVVNGTRYIEVLDPWPPGTGDRFFITYEAYVSGDNYSHWDDFYAVRYRGDRP